MASSDGIVQALLRGDGASMVGFATASDKAFTVLQPGALRIKVQDVLDFSEAAGWSVTDPLGNGTA